MGYATVIPSCKRPDMLKRALTSVYAQTVLPDRIHLVVDEIEDRKKYAFLGAYDNTLHVTFTGGGYGAARARNVGLNQVEQEFVFFLDDDDEWLPEKIEKQIQLLEGRPDAVAATCHFYRCIDGQRILVKRTNQQVTRCVKLWNYTGGFSCFGMRRTGQLAALRLREELAAAQDFEFYMRVAQFGGIALVPEPLVLFHIHDRERITGDRVKKRKSYLEIVRLNRELLSFRERCFLIGKVDLNNASVRGTYLSMLFYHFKGVVYLLIACKEPTLSASIWFSSVRAMCRRLRVRRTAMRS